MQSLDLGQRPAGDAGYLEAMTAVIFMGGLNRQVVAAKWEGFLTAFEGFDVTQVANLTDVDVERLSQDPAILRYKAKSQATVENARQMQELAGEQGSFAAWLRGLLEAKGVDATATEWAARFKYISEESSRRNLYAVGEEIGDVSDKVRRKYGPSES